MEQDLLTIPVGQIKAGFNYRRRFEPEGMKSLVEDIKARGVLSPILVRRLADGYQLIAGHRRVNAVIEALGVQAEIPAVVRVMTDEEATAAMVAENHQRENPSAIEDAEAATRMLGLCKGDKDETARRLNWTRSMLDRRLALMNAGQDVRDAYLEGKIELGHVEILAAMRREVQTRVLEQLRNSATLPSVSQLRAMAEQVLLNLETAIFDKRDCDGCQYNTSYQQTMFETSFDGVRCTNKECFDKKTEEELVIRQQALTETYQVVRIVRPGDNMTLIKLTADGPRGVGEDQAKACRTCADFGACVSAVPDKLGMAYKDICFNSTCHDQKVESHLAQQGPRSNKPKEAKAQEAAPGTDSHATGMPQVSQSKANTQSSGKSEPRNQIKEARERIWRGVFKRAALKLDVARSRALLIALCVYRPSTLDNTGLAEELIKVEGIGKLKTHDAGELTRELLGLDQAGLSAALMQIPAHVSVSMELESLTKIMTALGIRIEDFWKINQSFLEILTKTEIDAIAREIEVDKAMGEKTYTKALNSSKSEYISSILSVDGFDFKGKIPALMRW